MPSVKALRPVNFPLENRILTALPTDEYNRLLPELTPVRLPRGKVLWDAGDTIRYAYFVTGGMVSLLSTTGEGSSIEVGMVGSEGLAGISAMLRFEAIPYTVVVQISGHALKIKVETLRREFARGGRLQELLLRYAHTLLTQVSQSASCNRFHTVEERLCRWLLVSHDRVRSDVLTLTQEFLSQMMGVPRTSVSAIAVRLQREGLITYSRGVIRIVDRRGLEDYSCECYRVISDGIERYLAA